MHTHKSSRAGLELIPTMTRVKSCRGGERLVYRSDLFRGFALDVLDEVAARHSFVGIALSS
jgi:hypothetical protein